MIRVHIESTTPHDHGLRITRSGDLIKASCGLECKADEDGVSPRAPDTGSSLPVGFPGGETRPAGSGPRRIVRRGSLVTNVDRPTPGWGWGGFALTLSQSARWRIPADTGTPGSVTRFRWGVAWLSCRCPSLSTVFTLRDPFGTVRTHIACWLHRVHI